LRAVHGGQGGYRPKNTGYLLIHSSSSWFEPGFPGCFPNTVKIGAFPAIMQDRLEVRTVINTSGAFGEESKRSI
jgi:hypothetical protein